MSAKINLQKLIDFLKSSDVYERKYPENVVVKMELIVFRKKDGKGDLDIKTFRYSEVARGFKMCLKANSIPFLSAFYADGWVVDEYSGLEAEDNFVKNAIKNAMKPNQSEEQQ